MAKVKFAKVDSTIAFRDSHHLICIKIEDIDDFDYRPGKYIIIDTGMPLAESKTIKRAYTLLSYKPPLIYIAAEPVGQGSAYINDLRPQDRVCFSGPWGKLQMPQNDGKILMLASDTGISAVISLCQDPSMVDREVEIVWLRCAAKPFLSEAYIREMLVPQAKLDIRPLPGVDQTDKRKELSFGLVKEHPDIANKNLVLCGDGLMIDTLKGHFLTLAHPPLSLQTEYFFRKSS